NTGCTLRVVGQVLTDFSPRAFAMAGVSGLLEVSGLTIWGLHLWRVMSGRAGAGLTARQDAGPEIPDGPIEPGYTVAAVLERYPALLETFLRHGFTTLANPQFRRSIARVVTIARACSRMDVDCRLFVEALNRRRLEISVSEAAAIAGESGHESCCRQCAEAAAKTNPTQFPK
ncbi:MAG TPA: DUF1858 domain-containing protein, partial [Pirellulales bacterium]|nr:DUF1858 domain-containing protein [Pirellulales bacterium]